MEREHARAHARRGLVVFGALVVIAIVGVTAYRLWPRAPQWTDSEIATLQSLWLGSLPPPPADPSNAVADDQRAAAFGRQLFFDTRLSANGKVACASCHRVENAFTDGQAFSQGVGTTGRSAPSILGSSYSRWLFWDGRKDSQWAQALGPLESPVEHGSNRTFYAHVIAAHYRDTYSAIFGSLPDLSDRARFPASAGPVDDPAARAAWEQMAPADRETVTRIYANMGKAIAAFERQVRLGPSRFDTYVEAVLNNDPATQRTALTPDEVAGLRLFIGKAQCIACHNGPLLSDNNFYNLNVPGVHGQPADVGREAGVTQVANDEFNCLSAYSDAAAADCAHLANLAADATLRGAFRTMTLRNITETGPYMHAGQFATLEEVMAHYNTEVPGRVLNLTETELDQLVAFMQTLNGPVIVPPES